MTTFVLESGEGTFGAVAVGNLRTGGGDEAAVTLAAAATAAFASDNLTLSLTLTATGEGGSDTATIRFISAPRVIERAEADRFDVTLRKSNTRANAAILPLSEAGIAIWHNGAAAETYTIVQANADFKIASDEVRVAATALDVGVYAFTLQLTDGTLTASLPAQVSVGDPETAARARFVAQIEAGEIEWGTQINPYDLTPTVYDDPVFGSVTVALLAGTAGTETNPWPVYNVWHLQAIESVSVSHENVVSGNFNSFYGNTNSGRLEAHYYLAVDIDATTTRLWERGKGFTPISSKGTNRKFTGSIDGRGNAVRGLFINRGDAGLIEILDEKGAIKHLGVEEAEVRSNSGSAGILAAIGNGTIERVWTTGKVIGNIGFGGIGGLAGNSERGRTSDSWSTADVEDINQFGLAGGLFANKTGGEINDSWSAGDVTGNRRAGGFVAFSRNSAIRFRRSWASGAVVGSGQSRVGFGPEFETNTHNNSDYDSVYWNVQTSGVPSDGDLNAGSGVRLQGLTAGSFNNDDSWDVGGSDDFPLLTKLDMPWQAVNLARALTRAHFGSDESDESATVVMLDTNGEPAGNNSPADPTCSFVDGALRASTGYNNTTVEMRILAAKAGVALVASTGCEAIVEGSGAFVATVRLEFSAPATAGYAARRLTVDTLRDFVLSGPLEIVVPEPQPRVVAANASAGVTILTVSTSGGTNPTFADAENDNLKASGGGDTALVSLTENAPLAFASDNLTLSLPLTANADGESATATIRFISAPRAINNNAAFSKTFSSEAAVANTEVLAGGESGLAIWHFNGTETYTLSGADSALFNVDGGTGEVEIGSALAADTTYNFDLQLIGGESGAEVTATRAVQVIVEAAPVAVGPSQESLDAAAAFVAEIADDDFDWLADRAGAVSSLDWDGDTTLNVYDWTPLPGVTLTLGGADGSASKPWPIYNVWQLQAIDGRRVDLDDGTQSGKFTFFGGDSTTRLGAQYRLATDIDATPTRDWGNAGFNPIGGPTGADNVFNGFFDGGGYAVRGLFINRPGGDNIGLFSRIIKTGELAVSNLGVEEANISGGTNVGIFVGLAEASFSGVWTTGNVKSNETGGNGDNVGGLVGFFEVSASAGSASNTVMMSWSTADVKGVEDFVGGLIGYSNARAGSIVSDDNWAAGNVSGDAKVGGGAGVAGNVTFTRNWSSGAVSGEDQASTGGFVGDVLSDDGGGGNYVSVYWNLDTSGVTRSEGDSVNGSVVVQTLTVSNFGDEAAAAAWDFGDSDISDGVADFPLLTIHSKPWQAVNLARALTRFFGVGDAAAITLMTGTTVTTDGIRLDTNGLAPDERAGGTSTPSCSFVGINDEGVLRATTNYNGVTVDLRLLTGGDEKFVKAATDEKTENCEVGIQSDAVEFAATLRLEISAPAIGDDPAHAARSLTTDYALRITLTESTLPRADPLMIVAPEPQPRVVAANASAGVTILTVSTSGGTNPTFADAENDNLKASGGGDTALVSLTQDAAVAFASDNLTLSLPLTANADGNESATATIRFISAPRAIDNNAAFSKTFSSEAAVANTEVLAGGESGLAIWHFNGTETYTLSGADFASFDVDDGTGEVMIGNSALAADTTYNFDLQLIGGESGAEVTATRAMQVIVDAAPVIDPPDPPSGPIASRAAFVAAIERGDFNWFSAATDMIVIVDGGTSLDWDDDEIENPYDWTPLPGVTLTTGNEDGSAVNPWPIYNVWQLQAIDGVSVSRQRVKSSTDSFFGSGRLSLHYRLAANIDAMPSRDWSGRFDPIASFTGSLDGEGREIRGLHVSTFAGGNSGGAGLFAQIGDGGRVSRLGLPGVEVIAGGGAYRAGAVAATMRGSLSMVWATGTVRGGVFSNGGLAGRLIGGEVRESWFVGIVRGNGSNGGLVGLNGASVPAGNVVNSWAMARVQDDSFAQSNGGLIGRSSGGTLTASWSGGPVDAGTNTGGLIGRPSGGSSILSGGDNYLDASTSEISFAEPQGADYDVDTFVVESMTTLTVRGWDNTVWNFGKIVDTGNPLADPPVPGDNILDYPFLERIDALWPGMQAVAFADFQTNLLLAGAVLPNNGAAILVPGNVILTLDTNGLAANDPDPDDEDDDNRTPAATCENGATEAKTNYNDVTVRLQTTGEGSASFMVGCGINVGYRDDASSYGNFTLSLIIASQNATISGRAYVFGLDSAISSPLPADIAVPADAAAGYEFLTVSLYLGEVINNEGLLPVVNFRFQSASVSVLSQPRQAILSLLEGGAPAMFTRDEQIVHLSLTVSFGGNEEISEIVTLRSEPRGIAPPLPPGTIQLFHAQVGATVLGAGGAGIAIWHTFGAPTTFSIEPPHSSFGVDETTGLVTIATELSANTAYEFTLQLTDGTLNVTRAFPVMTGEQAAEQATLVVLNFRAPAAGEVVATLGWRPIGGAESYTLSRAEGSETGAYTPIDTSGGELLFGLQNLYLTYTETDLTLGSVYYYKLDSCNDFGCAPTSPILSLSVSSPPPLFDAAPDASPAIELVTLLQGAFSPVAIFQWDALLTTREGVNSDGDRYTLTTALAYDYHLSRSSQSADGGYIEILETSPSANDRQLGHFDADLTLGSVYYYRLSVCNEAGCADPSAVLMLPVDLGRRELDAPELAKRVFRDTSLASLTVTLTWPQVERSDKYRVFRATLVNESDESFTRYADGRIEYRLLKDLDYVEIYDGEGMTLALTASYFITNERGERELVEINANIHDDLAHIDTVSQDAVYYYQVEACYADNDCGDRSNFVRVGPPPPPPPPDGVSNLVIADFNIVESDTATVAEALLEWSAVEGPNNYRLLRAPIERGIDGEYDVIYEGGELSFTDSNLPLGDAYYYRVQACDGSSCGHPSEAVTLRLQRPGRARILFDQSGSSREVKSIGAALAPLSSVTVAWEETPDAQYYYVLRGGELAHHSAATISRLNGEPIPMLATTYREGLHGDNVRHYWVRACNAFGCGEASEAVVLGGGLLGIGEKDNPRAAGVSVALTLVDASATGNDVVDLTLTALVKAPTGVSASACRADVVTEVVDGKIVGNGGGPRVNFDWDARSGGEAEGRFYRFARSRFADSTSADWIDITAPAAVSRSDNSPLIANGIRTNFAATTFIDNSPFNENDILSNFAATTLYYGVQECAAVRFGTDDARFDVTLTLTNGNVIVTTAYSHESPICSAPVFVEVAPQSSLPQCAGDGVVSAPDKVDVLPDLSGSEIIPIYEVNEQEFVAVDEDGNKITATYAGPEYILAVAAFSVKWDSIPGAAYYRVTRESRDSDGGESSFAAYFVDQGTTEFIERTPFSPGLVNVYWVQACDRQNGCGPLSDPLELAAPPEELDASAVRSPVVVVAPVDSGFVAAIFVVGSPFADRYVLSRAPKPASGEATIYVDLQDRRCAVRAP